MKSKEYYHKQLDGHCAYCGDPITKKDTTRDHVIPRSRGGCGKEDNIKPACRRCNTLKADKSLEEFRLDLFKDSPNPSKEKFYFERVLESNVEAEVKERKETSQRNIPEWRLEKMDKDPGYRAMLKVLGLLSIYFVDLHRAIDNYMQACQPWSIIEGSLEEDYQMMSYLGAEYMRMQNLFLDLVELRYGTRKIKAFGESFLGILDVNTVLAEIDTLEKNLDN